MAHFVENYMKRDHCLCGMFCEQRMIKSSFRLTPIDLLIGQSQVYIAVVIIDLK